MMNRQLLIALSLVAMLCPPPPVWANEQNVAPGINDHYTDANYERWRDIFERDGREVWDRRHEVMRAIALQPGGVIADIGAGSGFYSRLFAKAVGDGGRVYAVDIAQNFIDAGLKRAKAEGIDNIVGVVNNQKSVELPAGSIDAAFISDTYHHFEYPITLMTSLYDALKPGGEVIIIDFIRRQGFSSPWIMGHVRANKAQVLDEVKSVGFELDSEETFMKAHYFLRLRKPG